MKKYIKANTTRDYRFTTKAGIPLAISNIVDDKFEFEDLKDDLVSGLISIEEFIYQLRQLSLKRFNSITLSKETDQYYRIMLIDSLDNIDYLIIYK